MHNGTSLQVGQLVWSLILLHSVFLSSVFMVLYIYTPCSQKRTPYILLISPVKLHRCKQFMSGRVLPRGRLPLHFISGRNLLRPVRWWGAGEGSEYKNILIDSVPAACNRTGFIYCREIAFFTGEGAQPPPQ